MGQIPSPLCLGHQRRIEDVFSELGSSVCVTQEIELPNFPKVNRKEPYDLRDTSGLSRQEFYLQLVAGVTLKEEIEVGSLGLS